MININQHMNVRALNYYIRVQADNISKGHDQAFKAARECITPCCLVVLFAFSYIFNQILQGNSFIVNLMVLINHHSKSKKKSNLPYEQYLRESALE